MSRPASMYTSETWQVRTGLRHLVSLKLEVTAYHPLHASAGSRAPVPSMLLFLDSEDLYIDGSGELSKIFG